MNVGFVFVSVVNWVDFGEMGWMWVKLGGFVWMLVHAGFVTVSLVNWVDFWRSGLDFGESGWIWLKLCVIGWRCLDLGECGFCVCVCGEVGGCW